MNLALYGTTVEVDETMKWDYTATVPIDQKARQIARRFGMKPLRSHAGRDGLVIRAAPRRWAETLRRVCYKRLISRQATKG